ncbi:hypothetical protein QE152_g40151 [Popillia japonica]|uniref:Uncharacterized protein n=1 Tax=Popillia japonica TaxID=7064 RepID=A0AAW1HRW4_POPJA
MEDPSQLVALHFKRYGRRIKEQIFSVRSTSGINTTSIYDFVKDLICKHRSDGRCGQTASPLGKFMRKSDKWCT